MADCVTFPAPLADNTGFLVTRVVMTPVLTGAALVTTLISLATLSAAMIRRSSPAFTYLTALAAVDFLFLICLIPRYIRDSQVLEPEVTYSRLMTYVAGGCYVVRSIALHVSNWYITLASVVFAMNIRSDTSLKHSWTKLGVTRIIIFVLCIAATMLNLPRFFEFNVEIVVGHCFEDAVFWDMTRTYLGESDVYMTLYTWIVLGVAFITPLVTLGITVIVVQARLGFRRFCAAPTCMQDARGDADRQLQLGKTLVILSCVSLLTTTPYTALQALATAFGTEKMSDKLPGFYELQLVCEALFLVRMVAPGVIYFCVYGDFKKSICRIMCCTADEYYEPCTLCCACCCCCRRSHEEEHIDSGVLDHQRAKENSTLERNARLSKSNAGFLGYRVKPTKEFSRWI